MQLLDFFLGDKTPLCPQGQNKPTYDDEFYADIEKCPKSPPLAYCDCYDTAALHSQIRAQEKVVNGNRQASQSAQDAYNRVAKLYPKQTVVSGPPLNVPSRASQKANIFTKAFDPKKRKIIVLVITSFLIFLAFINYD